MDTARHVLKLDVYSELGSWKFKASLQYVRSSLKSKRNRLVGIMSVLNLCGQATLGQIHEYEATWSKEQVLNQTGLCSETLCQYGWKDDSVVKNTCRVGFNS